MVSSRCDGWNSLLRIRRFRFPSSFYYGKHKMSNAFFFYHVRNVRTMMLIRHIHGWRTNRSGSCRSLNQNFAHVATSFYKNYISGHVSCLMRMILHIVSVNIRMLFPECECSAENDWKIDFIVWLFLKMCSYLPWVIQLQLFLLVLLCVLFSCRYLPKQCSMC